MSDSFTPFQFDNSFVREMAGLYEPWQGARVPNPQLVCFNLQLAEALGMNLAFSEDARLPFFFAGMLSAPGSEAVAMAYAGHQFGGFSPRLGDGRALLLGEVIDRQGRRCDIHLKGSGRTNFSRGGDGKAALGPVLREYLMGEAMHALGVPTTRALAALTTGEQIYRDGMKPGAVLVRVAASHIRVGTFEYLASRGDIEGLNKLTKYSLERHYPASAGEDNPALALLEQVANAQALLVARWMGLGFIHGVMNTDNVTISGETIDYGPCAFMDRYQAGTVFSSIDQEGRYAYGNQPGICRWNLARFAEALLPLLAEKESDAIALVHGVLDQFAATYTHAWLEVFAPKFGLAQTTEQDLDFLMEFLTLLGKLELDFTQAFRALSVSLAESADAEAWQQPALIALAREAGADEAALASLMDWHQRWRSRLEGSEPKQAILLMQAANPIYIPRNHLLQAALDDAEAGDMAGFETLLELVSRPFDEVPGKARYALPAASDAAPFRTFCGT